MKTKTNKTTELSGKRLDDEKNTTKLNVNGSVKKIITNQIKRDKALKLNVPAMAFEFPLADKCSEIQAKHSILTLSAMSIMYKELSKSCDNLITCYENQFSLKRPNLIRHK